MARSMLLGHNVMIVSVLSTMTSGFGPFFMYHDPSFNRVSVAPSISTKPWFLVAVVRLGPILRLYS